MLMYLLSKESKKLNTLDHTSCWRRWRGSKRVLLSRFSTASRTWSPGSMAQKRQRYPNTQLCIQARNQPRFQSRYASISIRFGNELYWKYGPESPSNPIRFGSRAGLPEMEAEYRMEATAAPSWQWPSSTGGSLLLQVEEEETLLQPCQLPHAAIHLPPRAQLTGG
ncbi:hypothetical protein SETIT_6G086500v2 [Setaria italica]|uniref:Uncharacterized protein n=1 Tax=Setaria italica TaxID=4555 RepID=A0A368RJF2_SETIT|nr:hypothetical protein SETIT_6G086500v2 [Setaria italica]